MNKSNIVRELEKFCSDNGVTFQSIVPKPGDKNQGSGKLIVIVADAKQVEISQSKSGSVN